MIYKAPTSVKNHGA